MQILKISLENDLQQWYLEYLIIEKQYYFLKDNYKFIWLFFYYILFDCYLVTCSRFKIYLYRK